MLTTRTTPHIHYFYLHQKYFSHVAPSLHPVYSPLFHRITGSLFNWLHHYGSGFGYGRCFSRLVLFQRAHPQSGIDDTSALTKYASMKQK